MTLMGRMCAVMTLCAVTGLLVSARAADDVNPFGPDQRLKNGKPSGKGWAHLYDNDLKGWKFESAYWKVKDGLLEGVSPGTPEHHYSYTEKEYGDFDIHIDVKLVGYNSGVCIRTKPTSFDDVPGYQVDMGDGYWGCLWDERGRGMVAKYEPADVAKILKVNDWNHYYIVARGHHIQAWLNGVKTIDIDDQKGNLTGAIGFQLTHGVGKRTEASFRNAWIREVKSK